MKRFSTFAALAALAALAVFSAPAFAQTKVGVIDAQRLVQESAVGKESAAKLQKLAAQKQEDMAKRQKDLRDLEQKINEQGKSLSEEAMEKLQKDYQAKAVEMNRFKDDAQREIDELQRKEMGEFERRVIPVIESVAKEQGYQLVFDKVRSGVLVTGDASDLTDAVIQKFNTQIAVPPARAAEAKPAPKPAAPPTKK